MASLTALVAGLAGSVQGAAVRSSAIPGDVAELAASIAFHGLCLAVASEVVGATALVACSGTRAVGEASTTIAADETATAHGSTAAHTRIAGVGASTSQVAGLAAVVASATGGSAAQAESRAVGLDMAQSLAVVALLRLSRARERAAVGLVARLLAVVAKALSRGANLGVVANVATLVASTTRERRHVDNVFGSCKKNLDRFSSVVSTTATTTATTSKS